MFVKYVAIAVIVLSATSCCFSTEGVRVSAVRVVSGPSESDSRKIVFLLFLNNNSSEQIFINGLLATGKEIERSDPRALYGYPYRARVSFFLPDRKRASFVSDVAVHLQAHLHPSSSTSVVISSERPSLDGVYDVRIEFLKPSEEPAFGLYNVTVETSGGITFINGTGLINLGDESLTVERKGGGVKAGKNEARGGLESEKNSGSTRPNGEESEVIKTVTLDELSSVTVKRVGIGMKKSGGTQDSALSEEDEGIGEREK